MQLVKFGKTENNATAFITSNTINTLQLLTAAWKQLR